MKNQITWSSLGIRLINGQKKQENRNGKIYMADRDIKREEIIMDGQLRDYTDVGLIEFDGRK